MNKRTISISILAIFAMLALAACGGLAPIANISNGNSAPVITMPTPIPPAPVQGAVSSGASSDLLSAYQGTLENIYSTVSPSVVNIRVVQKADPTSSGTSQLPGFPFFNLPQGQQPQQQQPQQQFQSALGSGFVWDQNGDIVTNNHVVQDADNITVTLNDKRVYKATIIGADASTDLALVKIDEKEMRRIGHE